MASIIIGGGLGPYLLAPIIDQGEGTWVVSVVALTGGVMLISLHAKLRY